MAELKVPDKCLFLGHSNNIQSKLESQHAAKRDAHLAEIQSLRQQVESRANEIHNLNSTIDSLRGVNEELKVCSLDFVPAAFLSCQRQRAFAVTSAGIEGGKNLAESAQDLERTRKAINVQLAEFEGVKKSLMRDLTNRCEKVVVGIKESFVDVDPSRLSSWKFSLMRSRSNIAT